ncbi:MAG: DUF6443 domain-containing protein, partial [Bacteroidota bacterium]
MNNLSGDVVMPPPNAASLGKYGDIPVTYYTGVPSIGVPIATLSEGPIAVPVHLSFHASGLKVAEMASWVGQGWSLSAGGMISRTVQGLPDEGAYGYYANARAFDTVAVANSGSNSCGIWNYSSSADLQAAFNNQLDTEPDIFSFNFGGYSGKFYMQQGQAPVLIPKQDLKIEVDYCSNPTSTTCFQSFTITTPDGTRYIFGQLPGDGPNQNSNNVAIETYTSSAADGSTINPVATTWYLRKVEAATTDQWIKLDYVNEKYSYRTARSCSGGGYDDTCDEPRLTYIDGKRLVKIYNDRQYIEFMANTDREDLHPYNNQPVAKRLDEIRVNIGTNKYKRFELSYDYWEDNTNYAQTGNYVDENKRLRLLSVQEKAQNDTQAIPPYTFVYHTRDGAPNYLPQRLSRAVDHWGFYNGADANNNHAGINMPLINEETYFIDTDELFNNCRYQFVGPLPFTAPGIANRESDEASMLLGNIKQINYPTGGYTAFAFEANDQFRSETQTIQLVRESRPCGNFDVYSSVFRFNNQGELNDATFEALSDAVACQPNDPYVFTVELTEPGNSNPVGTYVLQGASSALPMSDQGTLSTIFPNAMPNVDYRLRLISPDIPASFEINTIRTTEDNIAVGGLRVQQIRSHDGLESARDIIKTYSYRESSNPTRSSGQLYQMPQYWLHDWFGQINSNGSAGTNQLAPNLYYDNSIVPLSSFDGYHIGYLRVVEQHSLSGQSIYSYEDERAPTEPFSPNVRENNFYPIPPAPYRKKAGQVYQSSHWGSAGAIASEVNTVNNDPYEQNADFFIKTGYISRGSAGALPVWNAYYIRTGIYRLASVQNTRDGVVVNTTYDYNTNGDHLAPVAMTMINSDDKVHRTAYQYAHELGNQVMIDAHMIGIPLEQKKYVDGQLQGGGKLVYDGSSGHLQAHQYYEILKDDSELLRVTMNYNPDGTPLSKTNRGYAAEIYTWDNYRLTQKSYLNFQWDFNYKSNSYLMKDASDINQIGSTYRYDGLFRLTEQTSRNGGLYSTLTYHYSMPSWVRTYQSENNLAQRNYIDGLGRPLQTLSEQYGPGMEDVVHNAVEYDADGRIIKRFQPFEGAGAYAAGGGAFDRYAYEDNPLSREISRNFAGGGSIGTFYTANSAGDAVNNYHVAQAGAIYASGTLYKVIVTDEKGHPTETYTDKIGRTILVRKYWDGQKVDTYYLYDDRDNLVEVVPPDAGGPGNAKVNYLYGYDLRNRMISKRLPGANPQSFDYNDRDELERSSDGNGNILFYEYDGHGRDTIVKLQLPGELIPVKNPILSKTYDQGVGAIGKLSSSSAAILKPLGVTNTGLTTEYRYDNLGRLVNVNEQTFMGGTHLTGTGYEGATDRVRRQSIAYGPFSYAKRYRYDHVGRETHYFHKMVRGSVRDMPTYPLRVSSYNIKDELTGKSLSGLQSINYSYDLRGRLITINKLPLVFDAELMPEDPCGGGGGGGGDNPLDSLACGDVQVSLEDFLDIRFEASNLDVNCYDPCDDPEPPLPTCDYFTSVNFNPISSIQDTAINELILFNPALDINDPATAATIRDSIARFLDLNEHIYDDVIVQAASSGGLDIRIEGSSFNFGFITGGMENRQPFMDNCSIQQPTSAQQVANQTLALGQVDQIMASIDPNTLTYPVTLYHVNLYEGEERLLLAEELSLLPGAADIDKCEEFPGVSSTTAVNTGTQVQTMSFGQILNARKTNNKLNFEAPSICIDDPRGNCRIQKRYYAWSVGSAALLSTELSIAYNDLLAYNYPVKYEPTNSKVTDSDTWNMDTHQHGEVSWSIGHSIGVIPPAKVYNLTVAVEGDFEPQGVAYAALYSNGVFVPINGSQPYLTIDLTGGEIPGLTVDAITSKEQLANLQLVLLKTTGCGWWRIDGIKVDLDYEDRCDPCSEEGPACDEPERSLQTASLDILRSIIANQDTNSIVLPDTLYRLRFCDNEELYVLGQELSYIEGSYAIMQQLVMDRFDRLYRVVMDEVPMEMDAATFLLARGGHDLLINGYGCPVVQGYEAADCTYSVRVPDSSTWAYKVLPNSNFVRIVYERVTTKNCVGENPVELNQVKDSIQIAVFPRRGFRATLTDGGFIDRLTLHTRYQGQNGTLDVILNPTLVIGAYPELSSDLGFSDQDFYLDYNTSDRYAAAVKAAIDQAIDKWIDENDYPNVISYSSVSSSGGILGGVPTTYIEPRFIIYNDPISPYVTIGEGPNSNFISTGGIIRKRGNGLQRSLTIFTVTKHGVRTFANCDIWRDRIIPPVEIKLGLLI